MGSSNGGRIAIDFTLEHPGMVDALVCVGPSLSGYGFSEEKNRRISAILSAAERNPAEGMRAWLEDPHWPPFERNIGARRKVRRLLEERLRDLGTEDRSGRLVLPEPPALQRLSEITVPTLVIVGSRYDADNLAIAGLLEERIDAARKVIIGEAGHMVNMEKPKEFSRIVLSFLDEVLRTSSGGQR